MIEFPDLIVGKAVHVKPPEAQGKLDFTGPLGSCSNLYYGLCFQLGDWGFTVKKVDEYVEVKPGSVLYERTMAQKGRLGKRINASLDEVAKVVADYELAKHDVRKYKEIMDYYEEEDEHSLKAMFVEKVDAHAGPASILTMSRERWPTLYTDFLKLTDEDLEVDKVAKKYKISKAEAVVLVTKNKLYMEWRGLFRNAVRNRYKRLKELLAAKQKTIDYYRDWLKPYIARYRMIKEKYAEPSKIKETFESFISSAEVSSSNKILLWTWGSIVIAEKHRVAIERREKAFEIDPYDDYIRREFIFGPENSLVSEHPWITKDWVEEKVKEIKESSLEGEGPLDPDALYYAFIELDTDRSTLAMPGGKEIEDIVFDVTTHLMSQNLLLVKILELKAKEEEFERYVDQMLGVKKEAEEVEEIVKREYPKMYEVEKKPAPEKYVYKPSILRKVADQIGKVFMFIKRGPYETNFEARITKMIVSEAAGAYGDVISYLKTNMGVP